MQSTPPDVVHRVRSTWDLVAAFVATRLLCLAGLAWGGHHAAGGGGLASSLLSGAWHWDAHWYTGIAVSGYEFTVGTGSNVAFFPATPTLMGWLGRLVGHPVVAGMVLSTIESALALALMVGVMRSAVGTEAARRGALLLMVWPTSVFLVLPYADGLLLLAAVVTFALARQGRFVLAGLAGAVGAITRSTGIFLAVPLALFIRDRRGQSDRRLALAGLVGVGTAAYALGLLLRFGEPFGFAAAEAAGWHRVALPPPLPVAFTVVRFLAAPWFVARGRPDLPLADLLDLASITLVGWALWANRRRVPPAYLAWPAVGLLWPLLTGTTSVARYTLALFPAFALFAQRLSDRWFSAVVAVSVLLLGVASVSFGAGGWIG